VIAASFIVMARPPACSSGSPRRLRRAVHARLSRGRQRRGVPGQAGPWRI